MQVAARVSRITRLPPLPPSFFDPNARRLWLAPDASPYQQAHEQAHAEQQRRETRCWRWHARMMHTPYLCRLTRLLLEAEATGIALAAMRWLGTWTYAAEQEARRGVRSYVGSLFW